MSILRRVRRWAVLGGVVAAIAAYRSKKLAQNESRYRDPASVTRMKPPQA